jgi:hypothetical protein
VLPFRNLVHIAAALVFLFGAPGPKSALAQTSDDHPSAFASSLAEVSQVHRLAQHRKVYVPAYSAI